jgi:hypothetical protein
MLGVPYGTATAIQGGLPAPLFEVPHAVAPATEAMSAAAAAMRGSGSL